MHIYQMMASIQRAHLLSGATLGRASRPRITRHAEGPQTSISATDLKVNGSLVLGDWVLGDAVCSIVIVLDQHMTAPFVSRLW